MGSRCVQQAWATVVLAPVVVVLLSKADDTGTALPPPLSLCAFQIVPSHHRAVLMAGGTDWPQLGRRMMERNEDKCVDV